MRVSIRAFASRRKKLIAFNTEINALIKVASYALSNAIAVKGISRNTIIQIYKEANARHLLRTLRRLMFPVKRREKETIIARSGRKRRRDIFFVLHRRLFTRLLSICNKRETGTRPFSPQV